jgi:asparagine synthetase B (glutamine-hydrolysing)
MCGICVVLRRRVAVPAAIREFCTHEQTVSSSSSSEASTSASSVDWLQRRGPDVLSRIERESGALEMSGSVLHMRGVDGNAVSQPLVHADSGDALLWNGELFRCCALRLVDGSNDSTVVFDALRAALASDETLDATVRLLASFEGPWSLVMFDARRRRLLFGRDPLGRRSLLFGLCADRFCLSSVVCDVDDAHSWIEVAPRGLYCVALSDNEPTVQLVGWPDSSSDRDVNWSPFPPRAPLAQWPRGESCARFPPPHDEESDRCGADNGVCGAFLDALLDATRVRVRHVPRPPWRCEHAECRAQRAASVAVLFSGGVDSAVLAALCHAELPLDEPIDLINVSFAGERAPDRAAAAATLLELQSVAPCERQWRLVLVDVSEADVSAWQAHILRLCEPHGSVMDMTIGIALWFGARGVGRLHGSGAPYCSQARVLLTGHGADEQLGGYKRLRTRFAQGGWSAVQADIELDQRRLWGRNLGRDDRLISDCSREMRCVFLDERVFRMLATVPLEAICNLPAAEDGVGDKHLIRRAARRLGLTASARMAKRAIQFGTRIAAVYRQAARRTGVDGANKGQASFSAAAFTE